MNDDGDDDDDDDDDMHRYGDHAPGISVFQRKPTGNGGYEIFHTYSTFAAGLADFSTVFALLDITPEGRGDGTTVRSGKRNMYWVKHKEEY